MIKRLYRLLALVVVLALVAGLAGQAMAQPPDNGKVKVLITFRERPNLAKKRLVENHGGEVRHNFSIAPIMAASVPRRAMDRIRMSDDVVSIEEDVTVRIAAETLTWGVDRIDAEIVHGGNKGAGVKVAILDTGIDLGHPDLTVAGGRHFWGEGAQEDDNYDDDDDDGHGTHVAGTVAARDNEGGVIGVAPEADLYSVKFLDSTGHGSAIDLIRGIEWSVANGMDVINMSVETDVHVPALEAACDAAYASGVLLVSATGNSGNPSGTGDNVAYPGKYSSVIAVAATTNTIDDQRWSYSPTVGSSTGPDAELAAPGHDIYSTVPGGYGFKNGTSMAAAHVSGVAALVIATGVTEPELVRLSLQQTAEDLGAPGRDWLYGYGLVDAQAAVVPPNNWPPLAVAGPNQWIPDRDGNGTEQVTLDGSASHDTDGSIVTWEWTQGATSLGSGATLGSSFAAGSHNVVLTVTDDGNATDTDNVVITVYSIPTTTGQVPAAPAWAGNITGVDVAVGQTLYITPSGVWTSGSWTGDANGDTTVPLPGGGYIVPDANAFSLIGKIGAAGTPFFVGANYSAPVSVSGRLYLGMNDEFPDGFGDNSGALTVIVGLEGSAPEPSPGGGTGCFIATAAFNSYLDGRVETLRDFRDTYLVADGAGAGFVSLYYRLSPPVAEFIDAHPAMKPAVRVGLLPAVAVSTMAVGTTLAAKTAIAASLALASASLALAAWLRGRRRKTASGLSQD